MAGKLTKSIGPNSDQKGEIMGTDPSAKLFYGYINPEDEEGEDARWDIPDEYKPDAVCGLELFGYDGFIRYGLSVAASLKRADWSDAVNISPDHFNVPDEWNQQLAEYAREKGIDISGLTPGWHLVSIYF